ncbi:hypothetical protein [Bacillus pseudomycoides]|uniref:hypothetical protein n=1 Tax=Bacillus pseudomycoides TaxID=64104 RepID=UPI000BEC0FEA|nr:hypothetical protein [Bacillus pseudomycoides]PEA83803.1 hypothetical protein CON99_09545 [Bacillus pseudomycoides]
MYESLKKILGLTKQEIQQVFRNFKVPSSLHEYSNDYKTIDTLLLEQIKKTIGKNRVNYDRTVWFHLTRTNSDFKDGILPLGDIIENIWNDLYKLIEKEVSLEQWLEFRAKMETTSRSNSADLYRLKINEKKHWGPYALLVREVAFLSSEIGNHDYLGIPEIIEDICREFNDQFNLQLEKRFKDNHSKCIVHFYTTEGKEEWLGIVLNYLYHRFHDIEVDWDCNTCFDGRNMKVSPENILNVEFL